jgi:tryptophan synthase beta chain
MSADAKIGEAKLISYMSGPDDRGFFGLFGGRFVAETLMPLILDLERAYTAAKADPAFQAEIDHLNLHYSGRPSPLYYAGRMTKELGGAKIYFKRDELNHTGSHKINMPQPDPLAMRMGKTRIIAETGAGQHGVAVATVCAKYGLPCEIYMGAVDVERQAPNVARMKLLGAKLNPVSSGAGTLKDAMNEALRDWVTNVKDTYYLIGTAAGPHPYPAMVAVSIDHRHRTRTDDGARRPLARYAGCVHRRRLERDRPVPSVPR